MKLAQFERGASAEGPSCVVASFGSTRAILNTLLMRLVAQCVPDDIQRERLYNGLRSRSHHFTGGAVMETPSPTTTGASLGTIAPGGIASLYPNCPGMTSGITL